MLRELLNKIEIWIEEIRLYDPLMIFPWHRWSKARWEKRNILLDEKKLKKHKERKLRRKKNNGRS